MISIACGPPARATDADPVIPFTFGEVRWCAADRRPSPAGNRTLVGLDVDGDGQADLALAGPNCSGGSDGWCIDSYVHTKGGLDGGGALLRRGSCVGEK